jgi:hypothetical protein
MGGANPHRDDRNALRISFRNGIDHSIGKFIDRMGKRNAIAIATAHVTTYYCLCDQRTFCLSEDGMDEILELQGRQNAHRSSLRNGTDHSIAEIDLGG